MRSKAFWSGTSNTGERNHFLLVGKGKEYRTEEFNSWGQKLRFINAVIKERQGRLGLSVSIPLLEWGEMPIRVRRHQGTAHRFHTRTSSCSLVCLEAVPENLYFPLMSHCNMTIYVHYKKWLQILILFNQDKYLSVEFEDRMYLDVFWFWWYWFYIHLFLIKLLLSWNISNLSTILRKLEALIVFKHFVGSIKNVD